MTSPEETTQFTPKFDTAGLLAVIVRDARDNTILMFAHMNAEALAATQTTGLIHFWSRSRQKLWLKGETSGETFSVNRILVDCDQDCLIVDVTPNKSGAACHTGRRSCFYRALDGTTLQHLRD